MKFQGYLFAIISASFYGLIPLFILPVISAGYPLNITLFFRFLLAALMIAGYFLLKKRTLKLPLKEMLIVASLGVCYALSTHFLLWGYELLTAGIASSILFVFPVIVAIIMALFFHERLSKLAVLSLVLSLIGVVVLGVENTSAAINFKGIIVCLLSALCYAVYIVVVNKAKLNVSGLKLTCYSMLFSSFYFLGRALYLSEKWSVPDLPVALNIFLLSLVCTVLCLATLIMAIQLIGSTSTSVLSAMEPIVAVGVSVLFFGENFSLSLASGMLLIITGVVLNIAGNNRNRPASQTDLNLQDK